ncbi:hypothetical protein ACFUCV_12300 [Specibacter sp. NPDC057265]|uniref:hypothetical protein n=1 Tax=Specibacter sp. NPDC057265 TaxID=3346075 RepID=UPI00363501BC
MTTPGEESPERPAIDSSYGEIAPGVPRYGQYAPAGWEPPQEIQDAQKAALAGRNIAPAPSYPGFGGGQPGTSTMPAAIPGKVLTGARLIMLAGVIQAMSVIALLAVLFVPTLKASVIEVLQSSMAATPAMADAYADPALVNAALVVAFVISLAMAVVYFWLARAIRRGAGWARTTALVLGILSITFLVQPNPLAIAQILLGLVGVFLLYRSPAKEFFAAEKSRRGGR